MRYSCLRTRPPADERAPLIAVRTVEGSGGEVAALLIQEFYMKKTKWVVWDAVRRSDGLLWLHNYVDRDAANDHYGSETAYRPSACYREGGLVRLPR